MIEQEITLLTNGRISFQKCGNGLQFGYSKNRGVYSIRVKTSGEWNGLTIRAFWHIPDIKEPITSLLVDNVIKVPALVTSYKGEGRIVFEGSDGTKTVTSADVRYYVNKNSGTCDGTIPEPGTPAWQELVGTVKKYSDIAVEAKESAKKSADEAKQALEDTKDVKSQAIEEINSSKTAVIEEIENKKNLSIEEINSVKEDAKGELETLCDSTRDFANQAKEAADRAKASETKAQEYSNLSQSNANASSESASNAKKSEVSAKASEDASKKNADDSAATLQELKDGIASGNFKGEKGDKGDPGPAVALDTTLTHEGEAADAKATGDAISAVKARQNILTGSETGNPISVDDAFAVPLCGLTVYGKSTQDGTPTPDAPVPIVSAGDGGSVAVKVTGKNLFYEQEFQEYFINSVANTVGLATGNVSCVLQVVTGAKYYVTRNKIGTKFRVAVVDKLPTSGNPVTPSSGINADSKRQVEISATSKYMVIQCEDEASFSELMVSLDSSTTYSPYREQLLTLPTPTGLPGIPVTSGGNYTDQSGQQWVCDEVDLERGVRVQRVTTIVFSNNRGFTLEVTNNGIRFSRESKNLKKADTTTADSSAFCSALALGNAGATWTTPNVFTINIKLYVSFEGITSLGELQQYLQQTPMSLTAILATPIETPLTPAEIAAYKALTAYGPDTVVQAGDGAGVKLGYQRDVNIAIKRIEDAVASMT